MGVFLQRQPRPGLRPPCMTRASYISNVSSELRFEIAGAATTANALVGASRRPRQLVAGRWRGRGHRALVAFQVVAGVRSDITLATGCVGDRLRRRPVASVIGWGAGP